MVLRRSKGRATPEGSVEIVATGVGGVLVQGTPADVAAYVEQLTGAAASSGGRWYRVAVDGAAAVGNVAALAGTGREYVQFSPKALAALKEHGEIAADNGFFRSFVRDGKGHFAANLDWKQINTGPEQLLAVQSIAAQMAIQAAIKDLTAAVERVENKVDKLLKLVRSERLGSAIGDRATLQQLLDRVRRDGRITATDWSTIDWLGAQLARDAEALRSYVRSEIADLDAAPFVRPRSSELKELTEELLRESLALLIVTEANALMWHELRLANVATFEPDAYAGALEDARSHLEAFRAADQALVDSLSAAAAQLLQPTGFEGFTPLERRRLRTRADDLGEIIEWFANQRHLDTEPLEVLLPGLRESSAKARAVVTDGARFTQAAISRSVDRLRDRTSGAEPTERD
jgi:hypothetical protein